MILSFLIIISLLLLKHTLSNHSPSSIGYLLGGPAPECWLTDRATSIQIYQNNGCPDEITFHWDDIFRDTTVYTNQLYKLTFTLVIDFPNIIEGNNPAGSIIYDDDSINGTVQHVNLHCCKSIIGACVPNIESTPGLVTQFPAIATNLSSVSHSSTITLDIELSDPEIWTIIAHARFFTPEYQWDLALGLKQQFTNKANYIGVDDITRNGLIAYSTICALLCTASLITVVYFKDRKVIRFSTPEFCVLMLIGCTIGCLSSIPYGYVTEASCSMQILLPSIAFTLIIVPLLLKNWRIYKIFGTKNLVHQTITLTQLSTLLAMVLLCDIVYWIIWVGNSATKPVPTLISITSADLSTVFEWQCKGEYSNLMAYLLITFKGLQFIFGLVIGFYTRKAPTFFNESKFIASAFYILVLLLGLGLPLRSLIISQPNISYILLTIVFTWSCIMVCICFFAPKFYYLYKIPDNQVSWDDGSKKIELSPKNNLTSKRSSDSLPQNSFSERSLSPNSVEISYSSNHDIKLDNIPLSFDKNNETMHVLNSRTLESMLNLQNCADAIIQDAQTGLKIQSEETTKLFNMMKIMMHYGSHNFGWKFELNEKQKKTPSDEIKIKLINFDGSSSPISESTNNEPDFD